MSRSISSLWAKSGFPKSRLFKAKIYHLAEAKFIGQTVHCPPPALCAAPDPAGGNPETFGRVQVELKTDHLRQPKATVAVEGLRNMFGDDVKAQSDVMLGAVPKTKDDSLYYLKLRPSGGSRFETGLRGRGKDCPGSQGPPCFGDLFCNPRLISISVREPSAMSKSTTPSFLRWADIALSV